MFLPGYQHEYVHPTRASLIHRQGVLAALLLAATAAALLVFASKPAPVRAACAFTSPPSTYQDNQDRQLYLQTIDRKSVV